MLDFLDAQLGKILLVLALVWAGLGLWVNWYTPLPKELTEIEIRPVYVELDSKAKAQGVSESFYLTNNELARFAVVTHVYRSEVLVKQFVPVDLDVPPVTVRRPPQLLPEPGPSLEGAAKLPLFGDEFAPPAPGDVPPATPPKSANAPGKDGAPVPAKF
ncbi:MAG TPA: hypothetical protein VKX17_14100 [Planctomycetota bacterium]|nr:hypothetical protein [Planctomycetota bacterium]